MRTHFIAFSRLRCRRNLQETNQEVPGWLQSISMRAGSSFGGKPSRGRAGGGSRFGGRDFRNDRPGTNYGSYGGGSSYGGGGGYSGGGGGYGGSACTGHTLIAWVVLGLPYSLTLTPHVAQLSDNLLVGLQALALHLHSLHSTRKI